MNANKLRGKIVEKGMNIGEFCKAAGFTRATFDRKLRGDIEFNREEIERIINALEMTDEELKSIFFENIVA